MNKRNAFSTQWTVPFADSDAAGIVYFAHFAKYHHYAFERWVVEVLGLSYQEWFLSGHIAVPLRSLKQEFYSPLRPGDVVQAKVLLKSVGQTSIVITSELFALKDNRDAPKVASTETVHVFMDPKTGSKTPIPESIRALLEEQIAEE